MLSMSNLHIDENIEIGNTGITLKELLNKLNDKAENSAITSINNNIENLTTITNKLNTYRFYYGTEHYTEYCNEMIHNGVYLWSPTFANRPGSNYGTMIVVNSTGIEYNKRDNWCNQLAFGTDGVIWFRQSINAGPFGNWVRVN